MPRTLKLDLEDLAAETDGWVKMLEVEIEYEYERASRGTYSTPPVGPSLDVLACWIGTGTGRTNILPAIDSFDISLHDHVLELVEELYEEEPDEPDFDFD